MLAYALARRNIIINQMYNLDNDLKNTYIQTSNSLFVRIYNKIKNLIKN